MKKRIIAAVLICLVFAFLTACGGGEEKTSKPGTSTSVEKQSQKEKGGADLDEEKGTDQGQAVDEQAQIQEDGSLQNQAGAEGTQNNPEQSENGSIVVYFSRVGNTDFPGDVDAASSASIQADDGAIKGNAQMIAEWIAEEAGCDTFEILVKDSYPVDYDETVEQARNEQSEGARPALKTEIGDMNGYDTVYLVFPNWWGDLPMPVYSFFDACDLSGKKINVFITHEGSSFSRTIDTIQELEPEAEVTEGIAVRGGSVAEEEQDIRQWVSDHK